MKNAKRARKHGAEAIGSPLARIAPSLSQWEPMGNMAKNQKAAQEPTIGSTRAPSAARHEFFVIRGTGVYLHRSEETP